jgi:hypothetical protein
MANIPTGEFDAGRIAQELYDNDEVRGPLFQAVYDRWPGNEWNVPGTDEWQAAIDMILEGFDERYKEEYGEERWAEIRDALFESVDAGLT